MFDALKEKAQRASAAAGAAVRQGVDAARQGVTQGVDAAKGAVKRASEGNHAAAVDPDALEQLMAMGFPRAKGEQALTCVGGKDVAAAATLLCSEGSQERTSTQAGATAKSSGGPPQERLKDWVEVHGLTTESGKAMNGRLGQIVEYDEAQQRFLVDIDGECKFLRAENLRGASTSDRMMATMQAGLKSAKDSVQDVKKKAEALFSRSVASSTSKSAQAIAGGVDFGPTSVEHRRAAAEAAERRLAEARARNAGTMDDYRRLQREQAMARMAGQQGGSGAEQQPKKLVPQRVIGGAPDETADARDDEGEDMQRALAASLSQEQPDGAAAQGEVAATEVRVEDEDLELQRALAASLGASGGAADSTTSPPGGALEETSLGAAAPAEQDAGDLLEQDPELFELRLRQAMAEEELELQQALAASLAAEREALENAITSAPPDEDAARELEQTVAREKKTRQDCAELEQQLEQVKCQVAEHGELVSKEPETADAIAGDAQVDGIAEVAKAECHEAEAHTASTGTADATVEAAELPEEVVQPAATAGTADATVEAAELREEVVQPATTAGTADAGGEAAELPEDVVQPAATAGAPCNAEEVEAEAGQAPKELKEASADEATAPITKGEEAGPRDAPAEENLADPAMQAMSEEEMMFAPPARTETNAAKKAES